MEEKTVRCFISNACDSIRSKKGNVPTLLPIKARLYSMKRIDFQLMKSLATADDISPYASRLFHSYHRIAALSRTANNGALNLMTGV
jgi:hypothetical protein